MMYQAWRRPGTCSTASVRQRAKWRRETYKAKRQEKDVDKRVGGADTALYPDCEKKLAVVLATFATLFATVARERDASVVAGCLAELTGQWREQDGEEAKETIGRAHCDALVSLPEMKL